MLLPPHPHKLNIPTHHLADLGVLHIATTNQPADHDPGLTGEDEVPDLNIVNVDLLPVLTIIHPRPQAAPFV